MGSRLPMALSSEEIMTNLLLRNSAFKINCDCVESVSCVVKTETGMTYFLPTFSSCCNESHQSVQMSLAFSQGVVPKMKPVPVGWVHFRILFARLLTNRAYWLLIIQPSNGLYTSGQEK